MIELIYLIQHVLFTFKELLSSIIVNAIFTFAAIFLCGRESYYQESCIACIIDERFSNNFIVDGVGKYKPYVCVVCDEFLSTQNRTCIPIGQLIDKKYYISLHQ